MPSFAKLEACMQEPSQKPRNTTVVCLTAVLDPCSWPTS